MGDNRAALKAALENLNQPVEGLVKTYHKPYSRYTDQTPDAHEALGLNDLCMAHYGKDNEIRVVQKR